MEGEQNILLHMIGRKDGEGNALRQRWTCPVQPCWMADGLLREETNNHQAVTTTCCMVLRQTYGAWTY